MTSRRRIALAFLTAVPLILLVGGMMLSVTVPPVASLAWLLVAAPVAAPAAFVGALLLLRFPRSPIGWALYVQAITIGGEVFAIGWYEASLPGSVWLLWLASWTWAVGLTGLLVLLPLTFPDGRMPSARWRVVLWSAAVGLAGFIGGNALFPGVMVFGETNPLGWPAAVAILEPVRVAGALLIAGSVVAAVLAAVRRFRQARAVERAQLKWFAAGAVVALLGLAAMGVLYESGRAEAAQVVMGASGTALPLAIAVAIFRYRLYDIDRLVSRAVSYTLLSGVLAGVYGGGVLLVGRLLAPFGTGTDVTVAAATLAAAAMFAPARRRIQHSVDRRFNHSRYDAQREVEAFRARLRNHVELERVGADLTIAVERSVQPAGVTLWLRPAEAVR